VLQQFKWNRHWSIVTGIISLIVLAILMASGTDVSTTEYIPRPDEPVDYSDILREFGQGEGAPVILLVAVAGLLSVSIFQAIRSGYSTTRSLGMIIGLVALLSGALICVNTVTRLNFSGNSTTLEHLDRITVNERVYTLASMDTRLTEPYFLRNSLVLFECTDATESECHPVHTQFLGTELETLPPVMLEAFAGAVTLGVDGDVVYQGGNIIAPALPDDLQTITPENAESLTRLLSFNGLGYALDWSTDGEQLVVGGISGVWVYTFEEGRTETQILQTNSNGPMQQVIFNADATQLGIVTRFDETFNVGSFRVIDMTTGNEIDISQFDYGEVAAMGADLNVIASGLVNSVTVRRMDRARAFAAYETSEQRPVYAIDISPDGRLVAIAGQEIPPDDEDNENDDENATPFFGIEDFGYMSLLDLDTDEVVFSVQMLGTFDVRGVLAFSDDSRLIAYSRQNDIGDTEIVVWDIATQEEIQSFRILGTSSFVTAIDFNTDNMLFATGSRDGTVRLWDMESGDRLSTIQVADITINDLAFRPDGHVLALTSDSGEIVLLGAE